MHKPLSNRRYLGFVLLVGHALAISQANAGRWSSCVAYWERAGNPKVSEHAHPEKAMRQDHIWAEAPTHPESWRREREVELEEHLKHSPIASISPYKSEGKSEAYFVLFEDGTMAIFKPHQELGSATAESAMYELDRLLRFHMVPVTVRRKLKVHILGRPVEGSLQNFILGTHSATSDAALNLLHKPWATKMAILDSVSANPDRSHNFLVKNNQYIAIDHGQAFPDNLNAKKLKFYKMPRLSKDELDYLLSLEQKDFERVLAPHIGSEKAREVFKRFEKLRPQLQS